MEGIDQHYTVNSGNGTRQIHVQDRNFSERLGKRINLNSNLPKHSILNSSPSPKYCEKSCTDKPDLKTPSHLRTTPLNLLNQTPEQDSPKRLSNQLILSSSKRRRVSEIGHMQEMENSNSILEYDQNSLFSRSNLRSGVNLDYKESCLPNQSKPDIRVNTLKPSLQVNTSNLTLSPTKPCTNKSHIRSISPTPCPHRDFSPDLPSTHQEDLQKLRLSRPTLKIQKQSFPTKNMREPFQSLRTNCKIPSNSNLRRIESNEHLAVTKTRQKTLLPSTSSIKPIVSSANFNTSASIHTGNHDQVIRRTPSLNVLTSSSKNYSSHPSKIPISSSSMALSSFNNLGVSMIPLKTHGTTQASYAYSGSSESSSLPSPSSSLIPSLSASVLPYPSRLERSKYFTKSTPNLSKSSWNNNNTQGITGSTLRYTSGRNRCVSSNK